MLKKRQKKKIIILKNTSITPTAALYIYTCSHTYWEEKIISFNVHLTLSKIHGYSKMSNPKGEILKTGLCPFYIQ